MINEPDKCPNCGIPWRSDKSIYETFLHNGDSPRDAMDKAKLYGHSDESPKYFGINHVGVAYRGWYDGIWEWECKKCGHIEPRFVE